MGLSLPDHPEKGFSTIPMDASWVMDVTCFVSQGPTIHMSHEKKPGWLGYVGDEILPSYII